MGHASSVENLGVRAQNTQLRCGVGLLVVALFAAALMRSVGASPATLWLLLPLFMGGTYGIAAAATRTCGLTALSGHRLTECGREPIADRRELLKVRRRGWMVMVSSFAVSLIAVLILVAAR
jgi:hypothetical protein